MPKIVVNEEKPNASHDMVFAFPDTWEAVQYDAPNGFYRKHYKQFADSKCVDIVAFDSDRTQTTVWLIEVKDYRAFPRKDTSDILSEIAEKVRGTLACLLAGAFRDRSSFEGRVIQAQKICVAFHLEQPTKKSKLYPQILDWSNGTTKLKQRLRVIDPHPVLCNMNSHRSCAWTVEEKRGYNSGCIAETATRKFRFTTCLARWLYWRKHCVVG